ncbi:MAG: hypothetical protein Q9208_001919 [Pyrenodesmia sp. 3 TL-2023]
MVLMDSSHGEPGKYGGLKCLLNPVPTAPFARNPFPASRKNTMCRIEVLIYGCGHERFHRLSLPCPAGLCQEHNECHEDRTQIVRRRQVHSPPFCKACFDKEHAEIDNAFVRADDDFYRNHNLVRRYLRAKSGRIPDTEDQTRIRQRLRKRRLADRELLEVDFYGPTRRVPDVRSAFLYERPQRSPFRHEDCMEAYNRAVDDDDPSEDCGSQRSTLDDVEDLLQALQFIYDDSPQGNDDGEHFRHFLRQHRLRAEDTDHSAALQGLDSSWQMPAAEEAFAEEDDAGQDFSQPYWPADTFTEDSEFPSMPRYLLGDDFAVLDSPLAETLPTWQRRSPDASQRSSTTTTSTASTVFAVRASPATHQQIRIRREGPILIFNTRASPVVSTDEPIPAPPSNNAPNPVNPTSTHPPPSPTPPRLPPRRHSADNTDQDRRRGSDLLIRRGLLGPLTAADEEPVDDGGFRIRGAASRIGGSGC